ncbi:MAG: sugar phosphate nucleotidyltransferase [Bdellovibrionota bacterium]
MMSRVNALVLAAGFGTRLKPLTDECPKPLIPVAGVEALFYALYRISKAGIKKTIVNSHYKVEQIQQWLDVYRKSFPELDLDLSVEAEILGTGGTILRLLAERDLAGGLITLNGDTLSSLDLRPLVQDCSTFSVSYNGEYFKRYNPVYVDGQGNWAGLDEGVGLRPAHILGAHYLCASDLAWIKKRKEKLRSVGLFEGIYNLLKEAGRSPKAVEYLPQKTASDFWFDLTNRDFLSEAKRKLSGEYFPLWKPVLEKRHPGLARLEALEYWPLKSSLKS